MNFHSCPVCLFSLSIQVMMMQEIPHPASLTPPLFLFYFYLLSRFSPPAAKLVLIDGAGWLLREIPAFDGPLLKGWMHIRGVNYFAIRSYLPLI